MKRHRMEMDAMRAGFDREREELGRAMNMEMEKVKEEAASLVEEAKKGLQKGLSSHGCVGQGASVVSGSGEASGRAREGDFRQGGAGEKDNVLQSFNQREEERRQRLEREVEKLNRALVEMSGDRSEESDEAPRRAKGRTDSKSSRREEDDNDEGDFAYGRSPSKSRQPVKVTPSKGGSGGKVKSGFLGTDASLDRLRETQEQVMRQLREARERGGQYAAARGSYRTGGQAMFGGTGSGARHSAAGGAWGDQSELDASSILDSYLRGGT